MEWQHLPEDPAEAIVPPEPVVTPDLREPLPLIVLNPVPQPNSQELTEFLDGWRREYAEALQTTNDPTRQGQIWQETLQKLHEGFSQLPKYYQCVMRPPGKPRVDEEFRESLEAQQELEECLEEQGDFHAAEVIRGEEPPEVLEDRPPVIDQYPSREDIGRQRQQESEGRWERHQHQRHQLPPKRSGVIFRDVKIIPTDPKIDPPPHACINCWQHGHCRARCPRPRNGTYCDNCGRRGVMLVSTDIPCPRCSAAYKRRKPTPSGPTNTFGDPSPEVSPMTHAPTPRSRSPEPAPKQPPRIQPATSARPSTPEMCWSPMPPRPRVDTPSQEQPSTPEKPRAPTVYLRPLSSATKRTYRQPPREYEEAEDDQPPIPLERRVEVAVIPLQMARKKRTFQEGLDYLKKEVAELPVAVQRETVVRYVTTRSIYDC